MLAVAYTPGSGTVYDGPWVESRTSEEVGKLFEGWEPRALAVIKVCPLRHGIHQCDD